MIPTISVQLYVWIAVVYCFFLSYRSCASYAFIAWAIAFLLLVIPKGDEDE